ncbi:MAG: DUF1311 domain-containing protein [Pseudolabrys sp.]|nr:DUF1311 domain-containing protein [Pseudolabrys sp.]
MKVFACCAAACVLVLVLPAKAEEAVSKSYSECMEKSGGVTPMMQDCISAEYEKQDERLNTAYRLLLAPLPEKRKALARDAQRKWLTFRDANCGLYDNGGSAGRLAANECLLTHTARRAAELEALKSD